MYLRIPAFGGGEESLINFAITKTSKSAGGIYHVSKSPGDPEITSVLASELADNFNFGDKLEFFFTISSTVDVIEAVVNHRDQTFRGAKANAYSGSGSNFDELIKFHICADPTGGSPASALCTIYYFAVWYTFKNDNAFSIYTAGLQRKFSIFPLSIIFNSGATCYL